MSNELKKEHARRLHDALEAVLEPGETISLGRWTARWPTGPGITDESFIVVDFPDRRQATMGVNKGEFYFVGEFPSTSGAPAFDWEACADEVIADMEENAEDDNGRLEPMEEHLEDMDHYDELNDR